MDEAMKVVIFSTFIYAGLQADIWWNELAASKKTMWADVKKEFKAQWPAIVVAAKSQLDYQKELLALRLKEEDLGERITVAGVSTWSHLHYHGCLQKLVQDAGVANALVFIHQVREGLPRVIRDLTLPVPATWEAFLDKIKKANVDTIQDKAKREKEKKEMERAQNARIARLESRQMDPVEALCMQMQRAMLQPTNNMMQIVMMQANPSTTPPTRRQFRYVAANQNTQGQRPRGQRPIQEEQDLMRTRVNELVHQLDTQNGQTAYKEQIHQWETKWGRGARCTKQSPYLLTPGTAQICSGGCFRCGTHGHIGPECQVPIEDQLPKNESIWRGQSTCILGTFNRATAPQINIVFEHTYAYDRGEQGNGSRSSV
jgi:hypothetical protein